MIERHKIVCNECDWRGQRSQGLTAPNPFDDALKITGCPICHRVDCFRAVCDEPGCWDEVVSGVSTIAGYRSTCHEHIPA